RNKYPLNPQGNIWVNFASNQGYINEFYSAVFVHGTFLLSKGLFWFDNKIIDGLVNFFGTLIKGIASLSSWLDRYMVDGLINKIGSTTYYIGHLLRWAQNGRLQNYLSFAFTVVLIG